MVWLSDVIDMFYSSSVFLDVSNRLSLANPFTKGDYVIKNNILNKDQNIF